MHDDRRGVRPALLADAAEPAPAAVADLLSVRALTPSFTMRSSSASSKTGLRSNRFHCLARSRSSPISWALRFVRFSPIAARLSFISLQHLLRDHARQEAVERLLGAAVGILGQVRQGIDHRHRQRRRVADFEQRLLDAALGRDVDRDAWPSPCRAGSVPAQVSVLSMPWM